MSLPGIYEGREPREWKYDKLTILMEGRMVWNLDKTELESQLLK